MNSELGQKNEKRSVFFIVSLEVLDVLVNLVLFLLLGLLLLFLLLLGLAAADQQRRHRQRRQQDQQQQPGRPHRDWEMESTLFTVKFREETVCNRIEILHPQLQKECVLGRTNWVDTRSASAKAHAVVR